MRFRELTFAQRYTLIVSLLFVVSVGGVFVVDVARRGFSLESVHKLGHMSVGVVGLLLFRDPRKARWFCLGNGLLYGTIAATGYGSAAVHGHFAGPEFAGPAALNLDAFNLVDTLLHTGVATVGLVAFVRSASPARR